MKDPLQRFNKSQVIFYYWIGSTNGKGRDFKVKLWVFGLQSCFCCMSFFFLIQWDKVTDSKQKNFMWTRVEQLLVWLAKQKVKPLEHSMGNSEFRWGCIDFGAESFYHHFSFLASFIFFVDIVVPFYVACGHILYPIFFPYIYIYIFCLVHYFIKFNQAGSQIPEKLVTPTHPFWVFDQSFIIPSNRRKEKEQKRGKKRKERKAQKEAGNKVP